jgi:DNA-binding response OmpR family regulator
MKIAVLDDEKTQLQLIEQALIGGGDEVWGEPTTCHVFDSGVALLETLKKESFDCVLLDRQLPDMSGDVILQWLRQYGVGYTPVIMLTSLRDEEEVVNSLAAGADDYVVKPFRPKELVARVQRLTSRLLAIKTSQTSSSGEGEVSGPNKLLDLNLAQHVVSDDWRDLPTQIDLAGYRFERFSLSVVFDDQVVKLTEREFGLALLFFTNIGAVLSREAIFKSVWKRMDVPNSRALDTHVYRVRTKLALLPERGFVLRPVYGFGYRLDVIDGTFEES